jgi:hypothetical protein
MNDLEIFLSPFTEEHSTKTIKQWNALDIESIKQYSMQERFGKFCARGELALDFLQQEVLPTAEEGRFIIFNLEGVKNMNSSFANSLFANLVMREGPLVITSVAFKSCNPTVIAFINAALQLGTARWIDKEKKKQKEDVQ